MKTKPLQNLNESDFAAKLRGLADASRRLKKQGKDVKKLVAAQGINALAAVEKKTPGSANKFSPEIEKTILEYSLHNPTHGQRRVAKELNKAMGWKISEGGVRRVWIRNHIELIDLRLKRLKAFAEQGNKLSETQRSALEPKPIITKPQPKDLIANHPGELFAQDVFFMGDVKGVGKVYQQTGMDIFSGLVLAKAYLIKTAITASEFMNSKVLPFFAQSKAPLSNVITNPGLSYCGNESHPYELFLLLNGITHRTEKQTAPQLVRARDTFLKEFYQAVSTKTYASLEDLNHDLEDFIEYYNKTRKSVDRWKGQYPSSIFKDGVRQYLSSKNEEDYTPPKWEPKEEHMQ